MTIATMKTKRSLTLFWILLFVLPFCVEGKKVLYKGTATEAEIKDSWAWLSGGVACFCTGLLLSMIGFILIPIGKAFMENQAARDANQIVSSAHDSPYK